MPWTDSFPPLPRGRSSSDDCKYERNNRYRHNKKPAVLGAVGRRPFRYAQVRLLPARLPPHVLRWPAFAALALDDRDPEPNNVAEARSLSGRGWPDPGWFQERIARPSSDLDASVAPLIVGSAPGRPLDQGRPGRHEVLGVKALRAEAVCRVVDRSVQLCGKPWASRVPAASPRSLRRGPAVSRKATRRARPRRHHWADRDPHAPVRETSRGGRVVPGRPSVTAYVATFSRRRSPPRPHQPPETRSPTGLPNRRIQVFWPASIAGMRVGPRMRAHGLGVSPHAGCRDGGSFRLEARGLVNHRTTGGRR